MILVNGCTYEVHAIKWPSWRSLTVIACTALHHIFQVSLAVFAAFVLISDDNVLDAKKAFVTTNIIGILNWMSALLPTVISFSVQVLSLHPPRGTAGWVGVPQRVTSSTAPTRGTAGWEGVPEGYLTHCCRPSSSSLCRYSHCTHWGVPQGERVYHRRLTYVTWVPRGLHRHQAHSLYIPLALTSPTGMPSVPTRAPRSYITIRYAIYNHCGWLPQQRVTMTMQFPLCDEISSSVSSLWQDYLFVQPSSNDKLTIGTSSLL